MKQGANKIYGTGLAPSKVYIYMLNLTSILFCFYKYLKQLENMSHYKKFKSNWREDIFKLSNSLHQSKALATNATSIS